MFYIHAAQYTRTLAAGWSILYVYAHPFASSYEHAIKSDIHQHCDANIPVVGSSFVRVVILKSDDCSQRFVSQVHAKWGRVVVSSRMPAAG